MLAFAGNSLLCRLALRDTAIDFASFTAIRLLGGAVALYGLWRWRMRKPAQPRRLPGGWVSALALFAYAAGFSLAYLQLTAATGALLLFGCVQATMIGVALARGERLRLAQWAGLALALAGLVWLLWPGVSAPPPLPAIAMALAGVAWGVYSLRGRGAADPVGATAGNFVRAVPFALVVSAATLARARFDTAGAGYALASGVLTSGVGYALWYAALPALGATRAAVLQLSVPAIAAAGGVVLLGETLSPHLLLAAIAILGGILLVVTAGRRRSA